MAELCQSLVEKRFLIVLLVLNFNSEFKFGFPVEFILKGLKVFFICLQTLLTGSFFSHQCFPSLAHNQRRAEAGDGQAEARAGLNPGRAGPRQRRPAEQGNGTVISADFH